MVYGGLGLAILIGLLLFFFVSPVWGVIAFVLVLLLSGGADYGYNRRL